MRVSRRRPIRKRPAVVGISRASIAPRSTKSASDARRRAARRGRAGVRGRAAREGGAPRRRRRATPRRARGRSRAASARRLPGAGGRDRASARWRARSAPRRARGRGAPRRAPRRQPRAAPRTPRIFTSTHPRMRTCSVPSSATGAGVAGPERARDGPRSPPSSTVATSRARRRRAR